MNILPSKREPINFKKKPDYEIGDLVVQEHEICSWKRIYASRIMKLNVQVVHNLRPVIFNGEIACWQVDISDFKSNSNSVRIFKGIPGEGYVRVTQYLKKQLAYKKFNI